MIVLMWRTADKESKCTASALPGAAAKVETGNMIEPVLISGARLHSRVNHMEFIDLSARTPIKA
jgi:hypothetical protein